MKNTHHTHSKHILNEKEVTARVISRTRKSLTLLKFGTGEWFKMRMAASSII